MAVISLYYGKVNPSPEELIAMFVGDVVRVQADQGAQVFALTYRTGRTVQITIGQSKDEGAFLMAEDDR